MSKGQSLPHATVIYFLLAMKLAEKSGKKLPRSGLVQRYLGPATAAAPSALTPGAVRRRARGCGVVQGACGLGLCVLVGMSWPFCLGLSVLELLSWRCGLGLSVLG